MPPLDAPVEPLGVDEAIHLGSRWRRKQAAAGRHRRGERLGIFPPALEAGPVAGRERSWLVEEKQFGVAGAPDLAPASLEREPAANPLARRPAPRRQRAIVAVEAPATIAEEKATCRIGRQFAEWIDAIGKRHQPRLWRDHRHDATRFQRPVSTTPPGGRAISSGPRRRRHLRRMPRPMRDRRHAASHGPAAQRRSRRAAAPPRVRTDK